VIYGVGFNIVHMPKTGGTWLRTVCDRLPRQSKHKIVVRQHPNHRTVQALTEEEATLPTYIFVRNPWDWYVSLYGHWHGHIVHRRHEFRLAPKKLSPQWLRVHERFKGSFEQSMRPYSEGSPALDPQTGHVFESMSDIFSKFATREGLDLRVLRFEKGVSDAFQGILEEHCPEELTPEVLRLLSTHQRENASQRTKYQDYYTPKLRELVARLDEGLIRDHAYAFDA
jgi:hypothetical protein